MSDKNESKFNQIKRQKFITYSQFLSLRKDTQQSIDLFSKKPTGVGSSEAEKWLYAFAMVAEDSYNLFSLHYTAGEPIAPMRAQLEQVVAAYERYAVKLREFEGNANAMAFDIYTVDDYCPYLWLISLCYLLHRRDLLPRVAQLVDGPDKENVGLDWIVEEFLAYQDENRYETTNVIISKPYFQLSEAMASSENSESKIHLNQFLKSWYKDLSGAPWHDSHKNENGYSGYWAFEAAAAVLLLEIEDDSAFEQYLYYPKDLLAWARAHTGLSDSGQFEQGLRCECGQPCPKTGYWFTPARAQSRGHFEQGQPMPAFESSYGNVIWQWDINQN